MEFSHTKFSCDQYYAAKKKLEALWAEPSLNSDQNKLLLLNSCDAVFCAACSCLKSRDSVFCNCVMERNSMFNGHRNNKSFAVLWT
jgi:hypothetical protein